MTTNGTCHGPRWQYIPPTVAPAPGQDTMGPVWGSTAIGTSPRSVEGAA